MFYNTIYDKEEAFKSSKNIKILNNTKIIALT